MDEMFFGDEGMDEMDEDSGPEQLDAPPPSLLHSVSHLLALDMCNASHLAAAAGARAAPPTARGGRARLGLVFNSEDAASAAAAAKAWTAIAAAAPVNLAALRTLVALAHAASLSADVPKAMAAAMQSELLPAAARAAAKSAAAADVASYAAYASALGLSAGEGALLTNGRLVPLATPLDAVDVGLLEEYEFRQRAEGAAKLISELDPGKSDVAAWRSSVLMHAVAELSRVAQRATQQSGRGDRKVQLQPDDLYPGCARTSAHPSTLLCCRG